MNSIINQPQWEKCKYSKAEIRKAGGSIVDPNLTEEEKQNALSIIDNWRASHAYPLSVIYNKLRRIANEEGNMIVAQRLKRLDSLVEKLRRSPNTNLWKMQDLGGCRAIVGSVDKVYKVRVMLKESKIRHVLTKEKDYIETPKDSGYRSLHMVYLFHSDKDEEYNDKMRIEIQIRTRFQHLWATAVEAMDLFRGAKLKVGQGSTEDTRFFALASSLLARKEGCNIVPNTPVDTDALLREMKSLDSKNRYMDFLSNIRVMAKFEEENAKSDENGYCFLSLNYKSRSLSIKRFKPSKIEQAQLYRSKREKYCENNDEDCVLVRVSSISDLQAAYPNYFADIGDFVAMIQREMKMV